MVKYRPISPSVAWRNSQSSALSTAGRFLEIYFLTSPFANSIGCFQIVESIACAEHGLSKEDFQSAAAELESANLLERYGDYCLVKSWFRHHIWRSTLQGKCAQSASESYALLPEALKERWFNSCLEIGVPLHVMEEVCKPLRSPSIEAAKGDEYNNTTIQTKHEETESITSTPTQLVIPSNLDSFKDLLVKATAGLSAEISQQVVDELDGNIQAVKAGTRAPITNLKAWVGALSESAKIGDFVPYLGIPIVKARLAKSNERIRHEESYQRKTKKSERPQSQSHCDEILKARQMLNGGQA